MKPTDEKDDAVSAVLAPLRDRACDRLDDLTAARVLARAEAMLSSSAGADRTATVTARIAPSSISRRWLVPAGLMVWGALYLWAAVGEIRVVYPRATGRTRELALLTPRVIASLSGADVNPGVVPAKVSGPTRR